MPVVQVPLAPGYDRQFGDKADLGKTWGTDYNPATLNNFYPIKGNELTKAPFGLLTCPGKSTWATVPGNCVRGGLVVTINTVKVLYVVVDSDLYSITEQGVVSSSLGTLLTSTGPVKMAWNTISLFIADGGYRSDYSPLTSGFVQHNDYLASTVDFIDGYFLFNEGTDGKLWGTDLYSTTVVGTDFSTAEKRGDNLITVLVNRDDVWLFGDETTEIFRNQNDGTSDFQFAPSQGAVMEQGTCAPFSVSRIDNSIYWLSKNEYGQGVIFRADNYKPRVISTEAINRKIAGFTTISDAIAYTYLYSGHMFYVISFPTEQWTFVYDAATEQWHQRHSRTLEANGTYLDRRDRGNCHFFFAGKNLVGDSLSGKIFELDESIFTENSSTMIGEIITPILTDKVQRSTIYNYLLDFTSGFAGLSGQTLNPVITLQVSKDGGNTYGKERFGKMGKRGKFNSRCRWSLLGTARDWNMKHVYTEPLPVFINGYATITLESGDI